MIILCSLMNAMIENRVVQVSIPEASLRTGHLSPVLMVGRKDFPSVRTDVVKKVMIGKR